MILETQAQLREARHDAGLQFKCGTCGNVKDVQTSGGTGYGYSGEGADEKPICYECCGKRDRETMIADGRAILYLTTPKQRAFGLAPSSESKVSNWPGTLSFPCQVAVSGHNIARRRYDVWFVGPDGKRWHGVTCGDNTQICHCRRLKG